MIKSLFIVLVFIFGFIANVFSQTYPFRTYSIQDGLSESVVNDILQDQEGYLWFATGYGLNRFDGIDFENFFEESGLNHSKVLSLYQARDGKIWIGSAMGVNVMEKDSIYSLQPLAALNSTEVISIFEDKEGQFWFGTDGNGIWNYTNAKELIHYSTSQGLLSNQVRGIAESENGDIWLATRGGLTKLSDGDLTNYTIEDGLPENRTRDVQIDDQGTIWIATRAGLSKFNGQSFQNFGINQGIVDPKVQTLSLAKDGSIWLGTEGGVSQFKNGIFKNYTTNEGLSNDIINSSIIDREGNVWFGTFGGGASLFLGDYFENFNTESGLSNDLVTSMVEDEDGTLWIATYGGGMMALTDNGFEYLSMDDGLPDNRIYYITKDSKNRLWIGTRDGLSYLEKGKVITLSDAEFPFRKIRHVMEDSNGDYWISTEDEGIIRLYEGGYDEYNQGNGLASNNTRRSVEDEDGNVWVANYGGVSKIDTEKNIENYSIQEGVPNNGVMSVMKDNKGTIWISTFGGIAWFDGVRFVDITDEDGLPGKVAYFITQDRNENFWIGTNEGIAKLDISLFYSEDKSDKEKAIQILTREQGLISNEMNLGAVYEDKEGHFWFGSVEGVSHFNPEAYNGNQTAPKVHISRFIASGEEYETYGLELQHNENFVEIDFVALNYTAPNQVTYEYMLSGIDPDWQQTTSRNARYPSLPPGEYFFRVHAKNSNGIWGEEIALVRFKITPPFWMSWWFISLIALAIVGIIYLFYRNYQFMKMVDIERMRVRIASDLHDDVGASLTEIALQSDFLQASHVEPEFKQSLNQIGKQCRHVVTSLDDIVWSIDARNDTLGDLTDRMQDYIINVLEPKNFKVSYDFEELKMDNKLPVSVKENLYLIFKEAVNNIAKYSNGDEVVVSMHSKGGEYEFNIYDNGDTGRGTKKTGHGLRNMEMRAQRIGGMFYFEDNDGFTVTLKGKLN